MTSRSFLWLALGVAALPLLIQGTSGCSFTPGAFTINDNSYGCACVCETSTRDTDFLIATNSDDAEQNGNVVDLGGNDLDLGAQIVALRFANVSIPPGAIITSAYVQFTGVAAENAMTDLEIVGQLSTDAATFVAVNNNITDRPETVTSVDWSPGAWTAGGSGDNEKTPELKTIIEELVAQEHWTTNSAIVLRFMGTGQRSAVERDLDPNLAPVLHVTFNPSVTAILPVCASQEVLDSRVDGIINDAVADDDCRTRVTETLDDLNNKCGYPTPCSCKLHYPPSGDTFRDRGSCRNTTCPDTEATATCSNYHPIAYWECRLAGGTEAECAQHISATNVADGEEVCIAANTANAVAARMFGRQSTCEVAGTTEIEVGDREPQHDPMTTGIVEILGDPCPGGGCAVGTSLDLAMEPITFEVKWASDPTFYDLGAGGASSPLASLTGAGGLEATFAKDAVAGTGNGRRGIEGEGLAIDALNQEPLVLGVDWGAAVCDVNGNLASTVDGEAGVCTGDGTTECNADSPDCDDAGGTCNFDGEDSEPLIADVHLVGTIVNQPPTAGAGADQTVECTSTAGASFTVQGTATDPDGNIALTSWRSGTRIGTLVTQNLSFNSSLAIGGQANYFLRVIDTFAQGDEDDTKVQVVDTTAPQLTVSVSPASIWSGTHKQFLITATITTTDTCDATPTVKLLSITSNEPDNGLGDGDKAGDIQGAAFNTDDRQFLLRAERAGNGNGRTYTITYEARDDSGNATTKTATVTVPKSQK